MDSEVVLNEKSLAEPLRDDEGSDEKQESGSTSLSCKKVSLLIESSSSEVDLDESFGNLVVPPDGGWGWVIVFASFMSNVIVDGIIFSFGIFLMELATAFNETKGKTAWVGSLLAGCYLLIGPIASAFTNSFGSRQVSIAGSFIAAAGFVASAFASDMIYLNITFGVIGGIGFGFIYLPATTLACFYFDRKRALAMGIAVCGSGIGTFSVAPLVQYLTEEYGWRGAMLILAGLILNCAVFGCLYRPLEPPPRPLEKKINPLLVATNDEIDRKPLLLRMKQSREGNKWDSTDQMTVSSPAVNGSESGRKTTGNSLLVPPPAYKREQRSLSACITPSTSDGSPPPPYSEDGTEGGGSFQYVHMSGKKNSMFNYHRPSLPASNLMQRRRSSRVARLREDASRPFYRKDILYSCSLQRLQEFNSQPDLPHYHRSVTRIPEHKPRPSLANMAESQTDFSIIDSDEEEITKWPCFTAMIDTFQQMLDLTLLTSPTFIVLCLAGFLTLAGFFVPFIYIIDLASLSGNTKEQATLVLSVIGITNTVGRVFSGWVSDIPKVNALYINNIALTAGGIATCLMPVLASNYGLLMVCGAVFGFSIACFAALRSIILVQLHGLEKLSNTIGLLLLFQGIASVIGAPVAGLFFDSTGSYHASFYIAGTLIALSGIMGFSLPYISKWEKNKKLNNIYTSLNKELLTEDQSSDV